MLWFYCRPMLMQCRDTTHQGLRAVCGPRHGGNTTDLVKHLSMMRLGGGGGRPKERGRKVLPGRDTLDSLSQWQWQEWSRYRGRECVAIGDGYHCRRPWEGDSRLSGLQSVCWCSNNGSCSFLRGIVILKAHEAEMAVILPILFIIKEKAVWCLIANM